MADIHNSLRNELAECVLTNGGVKWQNDFT